MLATLVPKPFDQAGWVYEEKYDGIRILAYKEATRVRLLTRNELDRTDSFKGITEAINALHDATVLLDGEVVAFDAQMNVHALAAAVLFLVSGGEISHRC